MQEVQQNDTVKVHYTGKLDNGNVFDSSESREPLQFTVGKKMVIEGFENAVVGMKINETKTVTIPSEQAYGPVRNELIQDIPKEKLPPELDPEVGQELVSKTPNGQELIVKVVEVNDSTIKIDANHPLAGENLTFDIRLVEIA